MAQGNVRLNGALALKGEAISLSAVSAPNEPAIHVGGSGTALSISAVLGNVRLNGELVVHEQQAVSTSSVSGHWQQTDQNFEALTSVASEGAYAGGTATFEPLYGQGEVLLEPVSPSRGEILFAFLNVGATGVTTAPSKPSTSTLSPLASIGSEGTYGQSETSFAAMRSFAVENLAAPPAGAFLEQPASTLYATATEYRGVASLEQPYSTLTGRFGGVARVTQPAGSIILDATINVVGRAYAEQPTSTLTASGLGGSIGGAKLVQPRATVRAEDGWRLSMVSPRHALVVEATVGGAGQVELSQPRSVLTASGAEANYGRAYLEQPVGGLTPAGIILLEQPRAQLVASGGEQVGQYVYAAYAVNLAHAGITQFTDYPFRRIVEFNGEYYGVGPQGVFRIEGSADAGAVVKSVIETARPDFGSSLYKRVTYTYLLMDTADVLHISPLTGEDETHRRQALGSTQSGTHTRRVQFGRGLKARNWGIRIEHEGSDRFTLQDIEIVGEVLSRKVGG